MCNRHTVQVMDMSYREWVYSTGYGHVKQGMDVKSGIFYRVWIGLTGHDMGLLYR